jgi:hypothetical protein
MQRQLHIAILDGGQRRFGPRQVIEQCLEHGPDIGIRHLRGRRIFGNRQPQQGNLPTETALGTECPVLVERLPQVFDRLQKLEHSQAEAGFVVRGMSRQMGRQLPVPLGEVSRGQVLFDSRSLGRPSPGNIEQRNRGEQQCREQDRAVHGKAS